MRGRSPYRLHGTAAVIWGIGPQMYWLEPQSPLQKQAIFIVMNQYCYQGFCGLERFFLWSFLCLDVQGVGGLLTLEEF